MFKKKKKVKLYNINKLKPPGYILLAALWNLCQLQPKPTDRIWPKIEYDDVGRISERTQHHWFILQFVLDYYFF